MNCTMHVGSCTEGGSSSSSSRPLAGRPLQVGALLTYPLQVGLKGDPSSFHSSCEAFSSCMRKWEKKSRGPLHIADNLIWALNHGPDRGRSPGKVKSRRDENKACDRRDQRDEEWDDTDHDRLLWSNSQRATNHAEIEDQCAKIELRASTDSSRMDRRSILSARRRGEGERHEAEESAPTSDQQHRATRQEHVIKAPKFSCMHQLPRHRRKRPGSSVFCRGHGEETRFCKLQETEAEEDAQTRAALTASPDRVACERRAASVEKLPGRGSASTSVLSVENEERVARNAERLSDTFHEYLASGLTFSETVFARWPAMRLWTRCRRKRREKQVVRASFISCDVTTTPTRSWTCINTREDLVDTTRDTSTSLVERAKPPSSRIQKPRKSRPPLGTSTSCRRNFWSMLFLAILVHLFGLESMLDWSPLDGRKAWTRKADYYSNNMSRRLGASSERGSVGMISVQRKQPRRNCSSLGGIGDGGTQSLLRHRGDDPCRSGASSAIGEVEEWSARPPRTSSFSHTSRGTATGGILFAQAFDIVTVSHRAQVVQVNVEETCPCADVALPCYDQSAGEGEPQCMAPIFTASEIAESASNGQTLLRCGTLLDCVEVKLVSENQQKSLVPKQLLERSRLSQFRFETAPVLDSYGIPTTQKNRIEYSRWTYIGCFSAQVKDLTADATSSPPAQAYDPNACVQTCTGEGGLRRTEYYEMQQSVVIGISGLSCACIVDKMTVFTEAQDQCDIPCLPSFSNELCGGTGDATSNLWGLFMEYEYQSYGSSGAYDVWRYMWYTVVVIKDSTIRAGQTSGFAGNVIIEPERYYLHCANEQGQAVFQNQIRIVGQLLYGIVYDITGSRLAGLSMPSNVGRTPVIMQNTDDKWNYKLTTIEIDETDPMYPKLTQVGHDLNDENLQSIAGLYRANSQAQDNLVFTGVASIVSRADVRSYAVTQVDKNDRRLDRFFVFSMDEDPTTGGLARVKLIHQQALGFKGLQLYSSTQYGTISAVGPINGDMMYVVLGYLFADSSGTTRWHSYYDESNKATGRYWAQGMIRTFHVYPGGGASGPKNSTFLSYRNYPESPSAARPRLETAYSVLQVNMYSGSYDKWCQVEECETGTLHRSIDPEVPYANLFNAEAGFPLTLSAPKIEHARFTIEGLFLRVVFNMETTRGAIPIDTDGNRLPDRLDQTKDRSGGAKFDCAEVLVPATVALIGEFPDTSCVWKDDTNAGGGETLEVEFGPTSTLQLGDEIELLADRVFAKPVCSTPGDFNTCEFSPAAVGEGAVVSLPNPLLPPVVSVVPKDGTFSIDSCGSITLKADETKRTGGSASYAWSLDDAGGTPYVSLNTVSTAMNMTKYALLQQTMATTTGGTLYICVACMPQGFRYNMKVAVTSRWGLTSELQFVVEKADYPAPTIRTGSWSSATTRQASHGIRIDTEIRQSECAVGDQQLACSWECESHNPDWTPEGVTTTMECGNDVFEPAKLSFPVFGQTLLIPRYTLTPPTYSADDMAAGIQKFHEYRFRIVCVVVQSATDVTTQADQQQGQNAAETVIIRVERAELKVIMFPSGTEFPQKATTAAMNARFTMDPDREEVYSCLIDPGSLACSTLPDFGETGSYTFQCWKVTPAIIAAQQAQPSDVPDGATLCPGDNFLVKDTNSVCESGTEVPDSATCEQAATECGPYTWSSEDPNSNSEIGGCYYRTAENDVQYNGFGILTQAASGLADRRPICFYIPTTMITTTTVMGTTQVTSTGTVMSPCFTLQLGPNASPNGVYQTLTNGNIDNWKLRDYKLEDICTQKGGENVAKLDIGYNYLINQVTFRGGDPDAVPPVLPDCYCYYSEGLLLIDTSKMMLTTGDEYYTFQVTASHDDGRSGSASADIDVVDRPVLQVFLREDRWDPALAQLPLTSVYTDVVLEGTTSKDPQFEGALESYRWEIFKKQSGGNEFVTEWKNETSSFTWNDPNIIEWDPTRTSRLIFHLDPTSSERPLSTQLQKSTSYKIVLHVTAQVTAGQYAGTYFGKAQKIIHTAPGPPIRGGFTVMPDQYTFPDDLLTSADFGRIVHSSVMTYEFDAPQWRADSSGGTSTMDADLTYSFGFTPVSKDGVASATIWQTEDQSSTHFEISAHQITYDGQETLIANLKVCTVYKVCASSEATLSMNFNDEATYEEIKYALLGDGESAIDPQRVVAAQITADGIQNKLTADQYDELQTDFRNSVKRFDYGGMDQAELGSALQATSGAAGSLQDIDDTSTKNAEISDLLDAMGNGLDAFLTEPTADGASAIFSAFSSVIAGTLGQSANAGTGRRLEVVKLLADYEVEFGEDILETLENAVSREEEETRRKLAVETEHAAERVRAEAEGHEASHVIVEEQNPHAVDHDHSTEGGEEEDPNAVRTESIRELQAELGNVLTPTEIADLFGGQKGVSREIFVEKAGQKGTGSIERGPPTTGSGATTTSSSSASSSYLRQEKRMSEKYGRRYSRREFEKRLRILKRLDSLNYYIPASVAGGAMLGRKVWEKFRKTGPSLYGGVPGSYLVSSSQMLALDRKERVLGEFGSPLVTHRPRRRKGENHEHPGPRNLLVEIKPEYMKEWRRLDATRRLEGQQTAGGTIPLNPTGRHRADQHSRSTTMSSTSSTRCEFCGVYHTPFALTDSITGEYKPYSAYDERDMKYLLEKRARGGSSLQKNKGTPSGVFTITWNRTHSLYQVVDVKRRKIVAQTTNTMATRDGRRVRLLSHEERLRQLLGENGAATETDATTPGASSSSPLESLLSLFGHRASEQEDASGAQQRSLSATGIPSEGSSATSSMGHETTEQDIAAQQRRAVAAVAGVAHQEVVHRATGHDVPILLGKPEALEWYPNFVRVKAVPTVIHGCPSSFCDDVGLLCLTASDRARDVGGPLFGKERARWQCCDRANSETLCNRPPCWFRQKCPLPEDEVRAQFDRKQGQQLRRLRMDVDRQRSQRRLQQSSSTDSSTSQRLGLGGPDQRLSGSSVSRVLEAREARMRRLEDALFAQEYQQHELARCSVEDTWFRRWMSDEFERNTTVGRMSQRLNWTESTAPFSFADRARAYELYHRNPFRQLQMANALVVDPSVSDEEARIAFVEKHEQPLLRDARRINLQNELALASGVLVDAKREIEYESFDPMTAAQLKNDDALKLQAQRRIEMDTRRNISQALTRLSIFRDRTVRSLIPTLVTNARSPLSYDMDMFVMDIGKVTNMSAVTTAFQFPSEFIVPPDSPDEPTLTNPVTALAYQFIRYKTNIYYWSPSNPASQESAVITLLMFYASAEEYPVCMEGPGCNPGSDPIRVFADYHVYSSGQCLIWDRFYPDTAGGAWNGRDIINDGNGCLTLSLGDIGFFIDGRPSHILSLTEAPIFNRSTLVSNTKLAPFAILIMLLTVNWILVFLGYKQDERIRIDQRMGKLPYMNYNLDGDGIHTPLTTEDPISYKHAEDRNQLLVNTFWNVLKREHVWLAPLFYHETFTRPQRLLCMMALIQGLLALNAAVYGNPMTVMSSDHVVVAGILSALLMFPVYCVLLMLFGQRPQQVKRRMIKRRAMNRDLDLINKEKERLIAQSSMLPPHALTGGPNQLPVGGLARQNESLSLLALPPPIAAAPGTAAAAVGGGYGGVRGQLALPGPAGGMNPPAPKYPPPPGYAKALPPPQDLLPPIYFGKAGMPQLPALPSFDPQPKARTPPQSATAPGGFYGGQQALMASSNIEGAHQGHGGGTPLGGMRAISPRVASQPPPPAFLTGGTPTPSPPDGSPASGLSTMRSTTGGGGPLPPPPVTRPPAGPPGKPSGIPPRPPRSFEGSHNTCDACSSSPTTSEASSSGGPLASSINMIGGSDVRVTSTSRQVDARSATSDNQRIFTSSERSQIRGTTSRESHKMVHDHSLNIESDDDDAFLSSDDTVRNDHDRPSYLGNTRSSRINRSHQQDLEGGTSRGSAVRAPRPNRRTRSPRTDQHETASADESAQRTTHRHQHRRRISNVDVDEIEFEIDQIGEDQQDSQENESGTYDAQEQLAWDLDEEMVDHDHPSNNQMMVDREETEGPGWTSAVFKEGEHEMPPPPPPSGPPGASSGFDARPPPPPRPPNLNLSGMPPSSSGFGNFEPKTPSMPPPSTRGFMPATPKGMPPVIPFGTMRPDTLIQRGQPPAFHPAPFKMPPPPGMAGARPGPPPPGPAAPGTGYELALLGSTTGGDGGGFPGLPGSFAPGMPPGLPGPMSAGVPLPPPPPREDDSAFVRRVRLIYMDRVMREHQKQELLEVEAVGRPVPNWVFNLSTVMPYVTTATFVLGCICVILIYSLKFDSVQESHWYQASLVGLMMVVFLLDIIRAAVITVVELRKFEIRKRSRAGDFVVRKVQKQDPDGLPSVLKPKPKHRPMSTPAVPKVAPKFNNMERPRFLPEPGAPELMMGGTYESSFRSGPVGAPPPAPMLPPPGTPGRRTPPPAAPPGARTPPAPGTPVRRTPPGGRGPANIPFGQASPAGRMPGGAFNGETSPAQSVRSNLSQTLADRRAQSGTGPMPPMSRPPAPPPQTRSPRVTTPLAGQRGSPTPNRTPPRTPPGAQ
ncbi:unnamed protein product [Amoebophrya sp. A25]|nr:unnamed protein product [Amoebophrya sp. A25]|eukprot:GSA25T00024399001.1